MCTPFRNHKTVDSMKSFQTSVAERNEREDGIRARKRALSIFISGGNAGHGIVVKRRSPEFYLELFQAFCNNAGMHRTQWTAIFSSLFSFHCFEIWESLILGDTQWNVLERKKTFVLDSLLFSTQNNTPTVFLKTSNTFRYGRFDLKCSAFFLQFLQFRYVSLSFAVYFNFTSSQKICLPIKNNRLFDSDCNLEITSK